MQLRLRPITLQDASHIIKWRNDERVVSHCFSRETITEESNRNFFKNYVETGKYKQFIVERMVENYPVIYPIATVYLKDLDYTNKRCELCIFTSTDTEWEPENQSIAIKMLIEKAFKEYGMHKVYTYAFYKFPDEINLLKNAGFTMEAILKEEALNANGEYEDVVRLSIIKSEKK